MSEELTLEEFVTELEETANLYDPMSATHQQFMRAAREIRSLMNQKGLTNPPG